MPCLRIVQQYLPLHTLGIKDFQKARCPLLEAELGQPERFLGLLQQSLIKDIDQFSRGPRVLVMLMNPSG
jgi:hypothetical protein